MNLLNLDENHFKILKFDLTNFLKLKWTTFLLCAMLHDLFLDQALL
jgi:hypothetical protein